MSRAAPLLVLLLLACVREVPVEVIVEKEVVREVQVPGETVVVEKEVIKVVEVPTTIIKEVPVEVVATPTPEPTSTPTRTQMPPTATPTPTPTPTSTPMPTEATDGIDARLREYIRAGLIGEPEFLACDTQWPESACIGVEAGGLIFSSMDRDTGMALAVILEYHGVLANAQTCQFEWLRPETISCNTSLLDKEEAKLVLARVIAAEWPKLAEKVTSLQGP